MKEENITLELGREDYPLVLRQYGLEGAKRLAISMALAQYRARPITADMLYSCLATMETDLERMFPQAKTEAERAEEEREAAEEEMKYQEAIKAMKPYLGADGEQAYVNEWGEFPDWTSNEGGYDFPVWETESGSLTARVYNEGWDWLYLEKPEEDEEND